VKRKFNTTLESGGESEALASFPLCTPVTSVVRTFLNHGEHRGSQGKPTGPNKPAARRELAAYWRKPYNKDTPCLHIQTT